MNDFTVVMSVYHGDNASFFLQASRSVINQNLTPGEFIISVDGPVDESIEDVLSKISLHPIVKVLRLPENRGPGDSRHAAIIMAKYDVVALMDSDDICLPHRFERQFSYLKSNDLDVVGGYIEEFVKVPGDLKRIRSVPLAYKDIMKIGKWRQPINHVTIMFRRTTYINAGGYKSYRSIEDYDLIYRLLLLGARIENIPDVLVSVRLGSSFKNRRSGFEYLRRELSLINRMRRDRFLSKFQWILSSLARIFVRMSPEFLINLIYRSLRKKVSG